MSTSARASAAALAQIVAEELDVSFARVAMVLGDTGLAPDQGPTIASETIQLSAIPLRRAAAQARRFLVGRAAAIFGIAAEALIVEDGVVRPLADDNRRLSYAELIGEERIRLALADDARVKAPGAYRIVGASPPRVDLPAKATGGLVYVHDMRVPGMLHGRVVRPPYAGFDSGAHVGRSLIRVDEASVAHLPGVVTTVVVGDFVGVVAEREEQAEAAMRALSVDWREGAKPPDLTDVAAALTRNPSRRRKLLDKGDVDSALKSATTRLTRSYVWPYQLHGSIGPSAALADVTSDRARVWSGTQNPLMDAQRPRAASRPSGRRCRGDPDGGSGLLRPQRGGRRDGRRRAAVARGRSAGQGAADARSGASVGAEGRGPADER